MLLSNSLCCSEDEMIYHRENPQPQLFCCKDSMDRCASYFWLTQENWETICHCVLSFSFFFFYFSTFSCFTWILKREEQPCALCISIFHELQIFCLHSSGGWKFSIQSGCKPSFLEIAQKFLGYLTSCCFLYIHVNFSQWAHLCYFSSLTKRESK